MAESFLKKVTFERPTWPARLIRGDFNPRSNVPRKARLHSFCSGDVRSTLEVEAMSSPPAAAGSEEFRAQARPCMFPFRAFSAIFSRWRLAASEASGEPPAGGEVVPPPPARFRRGRRR